MITVQGPLHVIDPYLYAFYNWFRSHLWVQTVHTGHMKGLTLEEIVQLREDAGPVSRECNRECSMLQR